MLCGAPAGCSVCQTLRQTDSPGWPPLVNHQTNRLTVLPELLDLGVAVQRKARHRQHAAAGWRGAGREERWGDAMQLSVRAAMRAPSVGKARTWRTSGTCVCGSTSHANHHHMLRTGQPGIGTQLLSDCKPPQRQLTHPTVILSVNSLPSPSSMADSSSRPTILTSPAVAEGGAGKQGCEGTQGWRGQGGV